MSLVNTLSDDIEREINAVITEIEVLAYGDLTQLILKLGGLYEDLFRNQGIPITTICKTLCKKIGHIAGPALIYRTAQKHGKAWTRNGADEILHVESSLLPKYEMINVVKVTVEGLVKLERLGHKLQRQMTTQIIDQNPRLQDNVVIEDYARKNKRNDELTKEGQELMDQRRILEAWEKVEIVRRSATETLRSLAKEFRVSSKRIAAIVKDVKHTAVG